MLDAEMERAVCLLCFKCTLAMPSIVEGVGKILLNAGVLLACQIGHLTRAAGEINSHWHAYLGISIPIQHPGAITVVVSFVCSP